MSTLLSESYIVDTIYTVITPIVLIHNVILLFYHSHKLPLKNKDSKHKRGNNLIQKLSVISISSICVYIIYLIISVDLYQSFALNRVSCRIVVDVSLILFGNARFIAYFLFFQRLVDIFKDSAFEFRESTIKISYVLLIIAYIICVMYVALFGNGQYSELHESCAATFKWWFVFIFSCFDIFVCTLIQVLFARKLLLLNITVLNNDNDNDNDNYDDGKQNMYNQIMRILHRSTLLAFIAIITNELALVLTVIFRLPSLWTVFNSVINCWCIILMFAVHAKCYGIMCIMCTKCVNIKCLYCFACDCCCKIHKITVYHRAEKSDISVFNE